MDSTRRDFLLAGVAATTALSTVAAPTKRLHSDWVTLGKSNVKVTRLAHGVPVGGELDYLDEGTLAAAIKQRTLF